jgi:hypothetical protein
LTAAFARRSRDEWAAHFATLDACVTPVLDLDEAAVHPHAVARGGYLATEGTAYPQPAVSPRFSRSTTPVPGGPARPGEHTRAVLTEAGYAAAQVAELLAAGVDDPLDRGDRTNRRDDVPAEVIEVGDHLIGAHPRPLGAHKDGVHGHEGGEVGDLGDALVGCPDEGLFGCDRTELPRQLILGPGGELAPGIGEQALLGHRLEALECRLGGAAWDDLAAQRVPNEGLAEPDPLVLVDREQPHHLGDLRLGSDRPPVGKERRALDAALGHRADPQRRVRLLPGLDVRVDVLDLPEAAPMGDPRLGPQGPHQLDRLLEHGEPVGEAGSESDELGLPVTGSEPDDQVAAAEDVEGRQVLGEGDGVDERGLQHRRAEAHAGVQLGGQPREGRNRLEPAVVAVDVVVADGQVGHPRPLRCLDLPQQRVEVVSRGHRAVHVAEDDADLHGPAPSVITRSWLSYAWNARCGSGGRG